MRVATKEIIKKIDAYCVKKLGIPMCILMENAAIKVLKNIKEFNDFTLVCGAGNNGGDCLALARHLIALDKKVKVFVLGEVCKMSESTYTNLQILKNMKAHIIYITEESTLKELTSAVNESSITIDGIFGTGVSREVTGIYKRAIEIINENSKFTVAIDIPSGIDADSGKVLGEAVISNKTVSFGFYKEGFFNYGAQKYLGQIIIENIGIPKEAIEAYDNKTFITHRTFAAENIIKREKQSHKGDFGRVTIFAGSKGFTGAAYICTKAAVKTGAGLVTLCCPEDTLDILGNKLTEAMTLSFNNRQKLTSSNVIAIGPGMGNNKNTYDILEEVISNSSCPLVIDADGLNVLSDNLNLLKNKRCEIVITPHPKELERLTKISSSYINDNRIKIAKEFAKEHNVIVLLKGYYTVITDGDATFINSTGNSAMASGGMGDCLTGIIAALIAEGVKPLKAAALGAYIHGYAGDKLSSERYSVSATEVINEIPFTMKELLVN